MTPTVSLYRFFSRSNELLYIGITNRIPRRLDEHGDDKPWYLEVNDRFPEFAKALAWTPSPLQPTCPLASILRSRRGVYAIRRRAA